MLTSLPSHILALFDPAGPNQTPDHLHLQVYKNQSLTTTLDTLLLQAFLVQRASSTPTHPTLTWGPGQAIPELFHPC